MASELLKLHTFSIFRGVKCFVSGDIYETLNTWLPILLMLHLKEENFISVDIFSCVQIIYISISHLWPLYSLGPRCNQKSTKTVSN